MASPTQLPAWLDSHPSSRVTPPLETNAQTLPFFELGWQDFERLCLRLARRQSDVVDCRLYGVQGDDQEGIDLLARLTARAGYRVYQCKRQQEFAAARIVAAVDEFCTGAWRERSVEFVLCTAEPLSARARADEVVRQRERLREMNLDLLVWDAEGLSEELKNLPELVDDFFGRAWVRRFLGNDAAEQLGTRLDAGDVQQLRRSLGALYFATFSQHDQSVPFDDPVTPSGGSKVVLPDVIDRTGFNWEAASSPQPGALFELPRTDPAGWMGDEDEPPPREQEDPEDRDDEHREDADAWLAEGDRHLIVGGPGAGKSSLLRVVTLDLLSQAPRLANVARRWGTHLPVWIPFAQWTAALAQDAPATSILEFVASWLVLHGAPELVPLVARALADKRLLLLVDGLDEWKTLEAAHTAIDLLNIYLRHRDLPSIATARPQALRLLGMPSDEWRAAAVAPLLEHQQRPIAAFAIARELRRAQTQAELNSADEETTSFLAHVRVRPELDRLAQVPLVLRLMAVLWHQNVELPNSRYVAYEKLVELLLVTHPTQRRRAARLQQASSAVTPDVLRTSLAHLALQVQQRTNAALITREEAMGILVSFLQDATVGVGLDAKESKTVAAHILSEATESAGLLVAPAPESVGFYHRVLQEYLAAEALAAQSQEVWRSVVRTNACDPRWHDVLGALASILRSKADVGLLVAEVRASTSRLDRLLTAPLLADIAFGTSSCPPNLAKELAEDVVELIETGEGVSVRERLLDSAVGGLRAGATQATVRAAIERWLPRHELYREGLYLQVATWPPSESRTLCLQRGVFDEHVAECRAAARSLAQLSCEDSALESRLIGLAESSVTTRTRAVLLDALLSRSSPPARAIDLALAATDRSDELVIPATRARSLRGNQSSTDLRHLLEVGQWQSHVGYQWQEELPSLLTLGWPGSAELRDLCVRSLRDMGPGHIQPDIARRTLICGFTGDTAVAAMLASEIRPANPEGPLSARTVPHDREIWELFAVHARNSPAICSALDAWLPTSGYDIVEAHWAAQVTRSEGAKRVMLASLERGMPYWAARALLEGWGMGDKDVAEALLAVASGPAQRAQEIASLLGNIIRDRTECRKRLLDLLATPGLRRVDFVLRGLATTRSDAAEPKVVSAILEAIRDRLDSPLMRPRAMLIAHWGDDARVQALAQEEVDAPDGNLTAVAAAAVHSETLRSAVLRRLGVLPARLRFMLATRLRGYTDDASVSRALGRYRAEDDAPTRTVCALLWHAGSRYRNDDASTTGLLREVARRGPDLHSWSEAGLAVLLATGRVDTFASAREPEDATKPMIAHTEWGLRFNGPLWREVAAQWPDVKRALGSDLFSRLGRESEHVVWSALARVARRGSAAADDLAQYLDGVPVNAGLDPVFLEFLERCTPRSHRFREACLATVSGAQPHAPSRIVEEAGVIAATILGRAFRGDAEVLKRLAVPESQDDIALALPGLTFPLIAICEGWPDSPELERVLQCLRERRLNLPLCTATGVIARKSAPERVVLAVRDLASPNFPRMPSFAHAFVARSLTRRTRTDDAVYDGVATWALNTGAPADERVVLLRLLVEARGLTGDIGTASKELAEVELSGKSVPSNIRDPVTGIVRPRAHVLLEMLIGER